MFEYGPAEEEQIGFMVVDVVKVLKPFRARGVPAAVAAVALLRCVKKLMARMPGEHREALQTAAIAFLAGENPESRIVPPGMLH